MFSYKFADPPWISTGNLKPTGLALLWHGFFLLLSMFAKLLAQEKLWVFDTHQWSRRLNPGDMLPIVKELDYSASQKATEF